MPGIRIDDSGLCNICRNTPPLAELARQRSKINEEVGDVIRAARGAKPYDCIVAYSGGKDSSYTLKYLVEQHRLSCLAVTVDNGFLSDQVAGNCRAVCGQLGVDHVMFTPKSSFMTKMYRESALSETMHAPAAIQRASSICNSCISLINSHILRVAMQHGARLIAGGYLGGQLPRDASALRLRPGRTSTIRQSMIGRFVGHFGAEAGAYFELPENASSDTEIMVINPMLGLSVGEAEIIEELEPLGWKRPTDTGITSTNCRLNDLGVYIHSRRHGFHPYIFEIADQIRHGLLTREAGIAKLLAIPDHQQVGWLASRLGIGHNEI